MAMPIPELLRFTCLPNGSLAPWVVSLLIMGRRAEPFQPDEGIQEEQLMAAFAVQETTLIPGMSHTRSGGKTAG
jgi:hypothetical protein